MWLVDTIRNQVSFLKPLCLSIMGLNWQISASWFSWKWKRYINVWYKNYSVTRDNQTVNIFLIYFDSKYATLIYCYESKSWTYHPFIFQIPQYTTQHEVNCYFFFFSIYFFYQSNDMYTVAHHISTSYYLNLKQGRSRKNVRTSNMQS